MWRRLLALGVSAVTALVTVGLSPSAAAADVTPAASASTARDTRTAVAQQTAEALLIVAANRFPGQREALLRGVQLRLADLPDGLVGIAHGTTIYLDRDGGGHGWFVDPTPLQDEEFVDGVARPGSAAAGKLDLVSVIAHEMGHLAGLDDVAAADDLMGGTFVPGQRRWETTESVDPDRSLGTRDGLAFALRADDPVATDPAAPVTEPVAPATDPGTPVTDPGTPVTDPGTPVTDPGTPVTDPATPVTDPGTPVADLETPTTDPAPLTTDPSAPVPTDPTTTSIEPDASTTSTTTMDLTSQPLSLLMTPPLPATLTNTGTTADAHYDLSGADDTAVLETGTSGLRLRSTSATPTFDPIEFAKPTTSLTVSGIDGRDVVTVSGAVDLTGILLRILAESIVVDTGATLTARSVELTAADAAAAEVLATAFPDREIVQVPCRSLIWQNGSLHCITMQLSAGLLAPAH